MNKKSNIIHFEDIIEIPSTGKKFLIQSVKPETLEKLVMWTISTAKVIDTWSIIANMDEESLYKYYYYPMLKNSMEQGLLCMFSELESGEIVGYIAAEDIYVDESMTETFMDCGIELFDKMYEYLNANVLSLIERPKSRYEIILVDMIAIDPRFFKGGVAFNCVQSLFKKHPIASKASIIADAVNLPAELILKKLGFQQFWYKNYTDFKDVEGLEVFCTIPDIASNLGFDRSIFERYSMGILDRRARPKL